LATRRNILNCNCNCNCYNNKQTANSKQQTANSKQQTANSNQQSANSNSQNSKKQLGHHFIISSFHIMRRNEETAIHLGQGIMVASAESICSIPTSIQSKKQ
jgi:hypothetical protein